MKRVFAIDPGAGSRSQGDVSGWVEVDEHGEVLAFGNETPNKTLLEIVEKRDHHEAVLVVETFQPRGQPLYWQLIWAAVWIGRFAQAWGGEWDFIHREAVKLHLCGHTARKDGNVRAALIDRWGGQKKAVGVKKNPGPLYGLAKHAWPALGLAVAYHEGVRSQAPDDRPVRLRKRDAGKEPAVGSASAAEARRDQKRRPIRRTRRHPDG